MLEKFMNWYEGRTEYQLNWKKKTGNKIIGYFCTYVPEEIFYAFDILPVRIIRNSRYCSLSNPYIFDIFCAFCRSIFAEILSGAYDHLDGIITAQSCLHLRQPFFSSEIHKNFTFSHFICMPHFVQGKRAVDFLLKEYELLIKKLEEFTGKTITDSDLKKSISIVNKARKTLKEISSFRKLLSPPITGVDFFYISLSKMVVDAQTWLSEALMFKEKLKKVKIESSEKKERVMVVGFEDNNLELIKGIESHKALIVIEDSCLNTRVYWEEVEYDEDPLRAIAERYVSRIPCPSKDWPKRSRVERILNLASEFKVEKIVIATQDSCHPHIVDLPFIKKELTKAGFSTYILKYTLDMTSSEIKELLDPFFK